MSFAIVALSVCGRLLAVRSVGGLVCHGRRKRRWARFSLQVLGQRPQTETVLSRLWVAGDKSLQHPEAGVVEIHLHGERSWDAAAGDELRNRRVRDVGGELTDLVGGPDQRRVGLWALNENCGRLLHRDWLTPSALSDEITNL